MEQIFPTYAQEYILVTTVPVDIMDINTRISIITEIYANAKLSDPDIMYFHQVIKKSDATQSLNADHKEFLGFISFLFV